MPIKKSDYQLHLHSENFDICRLCLLKPESNRHIKFTNVFAPNKDGLILYTAVKKFLGVEIEKNDDRPKIICQNCYNAVLNWDTIRRRTEVSENIMNYMATVYKKK